MNNEDVSFSLQSGTSKKKKNARTEKAYEIEFLLPSTLIKQGKFYVLQEKQLHKS